MRREDDDGRNIFTVAQEIDEGNIPSFAPSRTSDRAIVERTSVREVNFHGVEFIAWPEGSNTLDEFLDRWHREVLWSLPNLQDLIRRDYVITGGEFSDDDQEGLRQLFTHWGQSRILCVTRVLPTGADRVNEALHQRALDECERDALHNDDLIPGEPVMMQVNDYNQMLFNGDQGLILNISEGGRPHPMAVFPRSDSFVAFHVESLRPVLLQSYAMTVHKAQGSEFDKVVLILPDRDLPINTREILYTALTRSRVSTVIIGSRQILKAGIAKVIIRDSGIGEKLRASCADDGGDRPEG
jgi:exodeoxyribonuclease V alpha subunit